MKLSGLRRRQWRSCLELMCREFLVIWLMCFHLASWMKKAICKKYKLQIQINLLHFIVLMPYYGLCRTMASYIVLMVPKE